MRVLLATCLELPEPDPDQRLLQEALATRGIEARYAAWDDPRETWTGADLIVIRSTWNYYLRPDDFLDWAERASRAAPLLNSLDVLFWNHDKRYLLELEHQGVPIVPTVRLPRGASVALPRLAVERAWREIVIKPAVSAASFRTARFAEHNWKDAEAHLAGLLSERDVLVQEYLPSVETHRERALVWIDGAFTHAVRKSPRLMKEAEDVSEAVPIAEEERVVGEKALSGVSTGKLLYARVDLVRDAMGHPRVMELELIEPSLFLLQHPPALERFAAAIMNRL
jgi:glutathione synthase/RimK-type ligase-like ATP-grasp enzyme